MSRFVIRSCLMAASLFCFQPAFADTLNFGDAVAAWSAACGQDVVAHCKGMKPGGGQLESCLQNNGTPACKAATVAFLANMDARFAAQDEAARICRSDVKRLCSGVQEGDARVLRCLMRTENFRKASVPCKQTLEAAGWLDEVSVKVK